MSTFNTRRYFFVFLFVSSFLLLLTFVVALRDMSVGLDTIRYITFFNAVLDGSGYKNQPVMIIIARLTQYVTSDPRAYLGVIFVLINLVYIRAIQIIIPKELKSSKLFSYLMFSLLGFLFLSDWYLAATTNGLRQGLALAILYLALINFLNKKIFSAILLFTISALTHYTVILILPFLWMYKLSVNVAFSIIVIFTFGYALGINEHLVSLIPPIYGIDIHQAISTYGIEADLWAGFNLSFVLYSEGWLLIFFLLKNYIPKPYAIIYKQALLTYMFLLMPYLTLGFGGFSNRFAFMAWLFIPFLQTLLLSVLKINTNLRCIMIFSLFFLGFIKFVTTFVVW